MRRGSVSFSNAKETPGGISLRFRHDRLRPEPVPHRVVQLGFRVREREDADSHRGTRADHCRVEHVFDDAAQPQVHRHAGPRCRRHTPARHRLGAKGRRCSGGEEAGEEVNRTQSGFSS